jgi:peptide/nickel transport system substrate-binding protein
LLNWRRLICVALAVVLLALAGCAPGATTPAGGTESQPTTLPVAPAPALPADSIALPFAARDVLNPYLAESLLNQALRTLLYEGLFAVDDSFAALPVLAEKAEKQSAFQWKITLRSGRVFHSGAAVTAADVVYSFKKAKASPLFQARLAHATGLLEQKDGSLLLTLNQANEYIAANLDFPIVPGGSADAPRLQQAENGYHFGAADTPPGTGRYQLKRKDDAYRLEYDSRHPGAAPTLRALALYGVNDTSSLLYGLEMGNYQFCYDDLSGGEVLRVSATAAHVPTTNFVYLGFQNNRAPLNDVKLRQALAACIDPTALAESFQGFFRAVEIPFPPAWYGVNAADFAQPHDVAAAKQRLTDLGYKEIKDGVRASKTRKLQFTLLVNGDNPFKLAAANAIKNQLALCQVGVTVNALEEAKYLAAVKAGSFDFYLGEVRLTPDLSLAPLLLSGGAATAGVNVWGKAASSYGQMLQGNTTPAQFISALREEQPFLPLGYRDGMAAAARQMNLTPRCRQNDLFFDIVNWKNG